MTDTEQMIRNYILMALNACEVDEKKAQHHAKVATACIMLELGDKSLGEESVE